MSLKLYHSAAPNGAVQIVVPDNQTWNILYGHITWNSSATGGNRWINITVTSPESHMSIVHPPRTTKSLGMPI